MNPLLGIYDHPMVVSYYDEYIRSSYATRTSEYFMEDFYEYSHDDPRISLDSIVKSFSWKSYGDIGVSSSNLCLFYNVGMEERRIAYRLSDGVDSMYEAREFLIRSLSEKLSDEFSFDYYSVREFIKKQDL